MAFKLEFSTANAAFEESPEEEAARILKDVASKLVNDHTAGPIRDINGNTVGEWSLTEDQ